jgi:integrase
MRSSPGPAGQALSGNAKRLHRAAIKALLKRAFRLRHIPSLPDLAVFRIKGATKRAVDKPAPLSLEELVALMEASGPKHRAMWAVGGGQGLRPSELGRIRWEDVDFEGRTLAVRGTKTEQSAAVVPMTGLTRRELRSWWEASGSPQSGLVFLTGSGKPYGHQGYKKPLRTAARMKPA